MSPANPEPARICILVAALGGEGGGVLTDWIAEAVRAAGLKVQCTSIPGVAQRTGATTYYLEVASGGAPSVMALTPLQGLVDLVIASELVEAARVAQNGYITADRTTLVASTHRVYSTSEKSAMGDGRFPAERAMKAVTALAKRPLLFDMEAAVLASRSALSAVMLGGVAACGVLPIAREVFEGVIRASGIAVDSNLAGFALGFELASGGRSLPASDAAALAGPLPQSAEELLASAKQAFPVESHFFLEQGIRRLVDYQDLGYAKLFIERLRPFAGSRNPGSDETRLLCETARHLALRMSFEDLIRVADLKTRRTRIERVRKEVDAKPGEPVVIVEYFKPGLEEVCGFLPPGLARAILGWAERKGKLASFNRGLYLKTTNVSGFLLLWLVARLRGVRRAGHRFAEEQENIQQWLKAVGQSALVSKTFALEVAALARLIKGYSGTYRNGLDNFNRILKDIVWPAIQGGHDATAEVQAALKAALTHAGPEIRPNPVTTASGAKPLVFMRKGAGAADVAAAAGQGGPPEKAAPAA